jgi:hypothetical protein
MITQGWAWLENATEKAIKWHYFINGKSLCGKFRVTSRNKLIQRKLDHNENCKVCVKAIIKINQEVK